MCKWRDGQRKLKESKQANKNTSRFKIIIFKSLQDIKIKKRKKQYTRSDKTNFSKWCSQQREMIRRIWFDVNTREQPSMCHSVCMTVFLWTSRWTAKNVNNDCGFDEQYFSEHKLVFAVMTKSAKWTVQTSHVIRKYWQWFPREKYLWKRLVNWC